MSPLRAASLHRVSSAGRNAVMRVTAHKELETKVHTKVRNHGEIFANLHKTSFEAPPGTGRSRARTSTRCSPRSTRTCPASMR